MGGLQTGGSAAVPFTKYRLRVHKRGADAEWTEYPPAKLDELATRAGDLGRMVNLVTSWAPKLDAVLEVVNGRVQLK